MAAAPEAEEMRRQATPEELSVLDPLGTLTPERRREIAQAARGERAARGSDPLAGRSGPGQSVFLLRGELLLMFEGGGTLVVVGGMGDGRYPVNRRIASVARSRAMSEVEMLALVDVVLDILVSSELFDAGAAGGDR